MVYSLLISVGLRFGVWASLRAVARILRASSMVGSSSGNGGGGVCFVVVVHAELWCTTSLSPRRMSFCLMASFVLPIWAAMM